LPWGRRWLKSWSPSRYPGCERRTILSI
jgi:hypothetical protein